MKNIKIGSSSTFIDNKGSYKQISCVKHFYMRSNKIKNIFVFCKKHDFLLQKGTMKLTTARLNYLHLTLVQRFTL